VLYNLLFIPSVPIVCRISVVGYKIVRLFYGEIVKNALKTKKNALKLSKNALNMHLKLILSKNAKMQSL